jgi:hypothetical protein
MVSGKVTIHFSVISFMKGCDLGDNGANDGVFSVNIGRFGPSWRHFTRKRAHFSCRPARGVSRA